MRYPYVAFDLDGTLIDSEEAVLRSLRDALLAAAGRDCPLEELTFALGITGEDCLARMDLQDPERVLEVWTARLGNYQKLVRLFPRVEELLKTLADGGVRLGVATSKTREELSFDFLPLGLEPYFSVVVTATDTRRHKPHPDPLLAFMERAGAAPAETLYVGDSPYDSQCARAAGVDFALAAWGCRGREIPAEHVLGSPMDLAELALG